MPTAREIRITELTDDLALTRAAVRKIITGGQAYSAEGRVMTRADLRALREIERDQANELAQLTRGGATRIYGVVHR